MNACRPERRSRAGLTTRDVPPSLTTRMKPASGLRRLALLLVVLPQLLVLGLGRGLVVCIAPGGHVRVEVAAGPCCGDREALTALRGGDRAEPHDEPDCGPCSDLRVAPAPRASRSTDARAGELPSFVPDALVEPPGSLLAAGTTRRAARDPGRGLEPPHLIQVRSIVLRC